MKKQLLSILVAAMLILIQGCASLKPYERVYVNDPEMQMGSDPGQNLQHYVHTIREGSTPAGTSKGSGGCGCN